jgi:hypothetical protein
MLAGLAMLCSAKSSCTSRLAHHLLLLVVGFAKERRTADHLLPLRQLKDMRKTLRPPTRRATAVNSAEQQLTNSVFKVSLRSWQAEYKARRNPAGAAEEEKALAQVGNK